MKTHRSFFQKTKLLALALLALALLALGARALALDAGENVTIAGKWQDEAAADYPMNGVRITIKDKLTPGGAADITGYLIAGNFTFVVPRTGYTYDVVIEAHFPGVDASGNVSAGGGAGAFDVMNPATALVITEAVGSNLVTFTSAKGGTNALQSGDTWTVFHGMADMVRESRRRLAVVKNAFVVDFPHPGISSYSPANKRVRINLLDRYDFDVVAHEYGHAIADETASVNSVAGGPHDGSNQYSYAPNAGTLGDKTKSLGLAFNEGFGTWFGGALLERSDFKGTYPRVGDGKYQDTEDSTANLSYEDNTTQTYFGDDTENALYQLFWDLHDAANENNKRTTKIDGLRDRMALGVPGVWNLFKGSGSTTISDFWKKSFLPAGAVAGFLPGVGSAVANPAALQKAVDAAETFAEFGVAPLLFKPDAGSKLDLDPPAGDPRPKFEWAQEATKSANSVPSAGANADLALNKFQLVIYASDLGTELFHKPAIAAKVYTMTDADLAALKAAIDALEAGGQDIASVKAVIIGESDTKAPTTGPYLSNAVELLVQDFNRAVVAVVDSSGSNTSTDPSDQRIVASKESIRRLVSQADADLDPTKVPDIAAAVDFDSSVRVLSQFADPDSVEPTLDAIDSSGGTSIDGGLNTGISLIESINAGSFLALFQDRTAILLFTDGQNNSGNGPVIAAIANATSKGIRVHYGFLNPQGTPKQTGPDVPEEGAVIAADTSSRAPRGTPATIQEAVLESGGVFGVISDAESQNAFVQQVFARGLTNADEDDALGGKIVGQTISTESITPVQDEAAFEFFGTRNEQARVIVESDDFQAAVSIYDRDGNLLEFVIDTDGDGRVEIPLVLPYTGDYLVTVYPNDGNTGVFTIFVDVQNIRFNYTRVATESDAYDRRSAFQDNFSEEFVGTYSGLVRPTQGTGQGGFNLKLRKSGGFSAGAVINGQKFSVRGEFNEFGTFAVTFTHKTLGEVTVLLRLTETFLGKKVEGSIDGATFFLDVDGDLAAYKKRTNPFANPNTFTFVLPSEGDSNLPGDGFGVAKVTEGGTVRLAGALGDTKKFSVSSVLSQENTFPVSIALYKAAKGALPGGLFGELTVRTTLAGQIDGTLAWRKPAAARDKHYPLGFFGRVPFIGAAYRKPARGTERIIVLGEFAGNLRATFGPGGLAAQAGDQSFTVGLDNKATLVGPDATVPVKLKFSPASGLFSGSFPTYLAKPKTAKFVGAVLQSQNRAAGHFVGVGQTGFVFLEGYDDTDVRISSPLAVNATVGVLFNYQITTVNEPFIYAASGFPEGFTIAEIDGLISGTFTEPGVVHASVSAIDRTGRRATQKITITVAP